MSVLRTLGLVIIALAIALVDWIVPLGFGESVFEILQAVFMLAAVWSAGDS